MRRVANRHLAPEFAVTALICGALAPANAQTIGSTYSSSAAKDCRLIGKPSGLDGSTRRLCPGKAGLMVLVSEDDLRETVSVGTNRAAAAKEPAAQAWLAPFNSTTVTIEWRAANGKPFAIIQRWHLADNAVEDRKADAGGDTIAAGPVCHVAMSTLRPTRTPTNSRARPPTNRRAASNAARTRQR